MQLSEEFLIGKFRPSGEEILAKEGLDSLYIYYDGKFLRGKDAKVSPYDPGWLNGYGVFEGIRAYDGSIFKLDEHVERLFDSAKGLALEIPLSRSEIKEAIVLTVRKNQLRNCHIRPVVTRGPGKLGLNPRRGVRPSLLILSYPFSPTHEGKPAKVIISSVRRKSPSSVDSKLKSLSYVDFIVAFTQAAALGMDDDILLDQDGYVGEGCGDNIAIIKGKRFSTPPPTAALEGITLRTLMELCPQIGLSPDYRQITPLELYTADEVILCGTGAEIAPVAEIDGRTIGSGAPGPITKKLTEEYDRVVRSEHLTPVYE